MVERGVATPHSAAEVLHGNSGLRLFQHPDDLLFTKAAPFHGASPLVVLYPEKLSFDWTKFRGAGQRDSSLKELFGVASNTGCTKVNSFRCYPQTRASQRAENQYHR